MDTYINFIRKLRLEFEDLEARREKWTNGSWHRNLLQPHSEWCKLPFDPRSDDLEKYIFACFDVGIFYEFKNNWPGIRELHNKITEAIRSAATWIPHAKSEVLGVFEQAFFPPS